MAAPYNTAAIANWFLDRADQDGVKLDPMKLQKLIYFAHGWYLSLANQPLITEHPQAWNYGPVIPSIYHEFKNFGRGPIAGRAWDLDYSGVTPKTILNAKIVEPHVDNEPEIQEFLEQIWTVYGSKSAVYLSNLSHVPNGAWDKAYKAAGGNRNVDIPDSFIKEEFDAKRQRGAVAE
ncbi:MAG: SocA family protein [Alphaproteobacteria bacterium]|nr:SocA family protein [Alphaproteobacteria bacterium]